MDQNNFDTSQVKKSVKRVNNSRQLSLLIKLVFIAIIIFPVSASIYYFGYRPLKESIYISKFDKKNKNSGATKEQIKLSDKLQTLELDESYLNSRLKMAVTDSVSLSINLHDSVLNMEIKGVVVRTCKISDYKISKGFMKMTHEQLHDWIDNPFTLQNTVSTILAAPVVYIKAPKDTIEAGQKSQIPTLPADTAVYYRLNFDRDLVVDIDQKETPPSEGKKERRKYRFHNLYQAASDNIRFLFHSEKSRYKLWMRLELSREDARIVYRALPDKAMLTLKIR
ncbi:MAG: hypothetical protein NT175_06735 [Bacteroidetes bacterium]|nr:hypothetical protein [Bacteroidota bacterium]